MKLFDWSSKSTWRWFINNRNSLEKTKILEYLQKHDSFIVYHGCRPKEVGTYYNNGIRVSDLNKLNNQARNIYLTNKLPWLTESHLDQAIKSIIDVDRGKVFVVVDDRELIKYCGHYMIYGSEHICGIGASLTRMLGYDYRNILKTIGIPTVFKVKLPLSYLNQQQLSEFADWLTDQGMESLKCNASAPLLSWSFVFRRDIPGEFIMSHNHPEEIPDPLNNNIIYRYKY